MPKYCPENERVKRDYAFYLEAANGKQSATIDAALRAIERFELSTSRKPFRKFHIEQARSFRARLVEDLGPNGKRLSAATIASTLKHLRNFFLWLSHEPGFDEDKALGVEPSLIFLPPCPEAGDVKTLLPAWQNAFFQAQPLGVDEVPNRPVIYLDAASTQTHPRSKQRKHRAGRSRQTKSGAEANQNRSTTQYGRVNRSIQL